MSYYIIEFFKYEIAQGLYIIWDGPANISRLCLYFYIQIELNEIHFLLSSQLSRRIEYLTPYTELLF